MTLAGSLERLCAAVDGLAEALVAARVTVCEDQPPGSATLAVDELADALVELEGEASRMRDEVHRGLLGDDEPARTEIARLVALVQRVTNAIADGLATRVTASQRIAELERAARRGGPPWRQWWLAAASGVGDCEPAARELRDALFECWRELTEDALSSGAPRSSPGAAGIAELPIAVAAHGDFSGRLTFRPSADDPGGGGHTQ